MAQVFRYAQLVMGPAGSGKSTYCKILQEHFEAKGKVLRVLNLDPAAEKFSYRCDIDIRDCITVEDVMDELDLGPNGGLVFALEHLVENIDWLTDELDALGEDDYILIDSPGQIELYTHLTVMHEVVRTLQRIGFNICGVYCVDCTFLTDGHKFISANLMALAAMNNLATPHINVLTKCDMIKDKAKLDALLDTEPSLIIHELSTRSSSEKFRSLNEAIAKVVNEFNLVKFYPLDFTDEDSIQAISYTIDAMIQYGENLEPKDVEEMDLDR